MFEAIGLVPTKLAFDRGCYTVQLPIAQTVLHIIGQFVSLSHIQVRIYADFVSCSWCRRFNLS